METHLKISSTCGFLAVLASPVSYTIVALIQPGYSLLNNSISSLGAKGAPFSLYISIMFIIGGILEAILASGIYHPNKSNKWVLFGSILISFAGIFNSSGSGIFPEGYPWTGSMHGIVSEIGVYSMMIAPFILIIGWRKIPEWHDMRQITKLVAILFMIGLAMEQLVNYYHFGSGAVQRFEDFTYYFWIFCFALKLGKIAQSIS